MLTDTKIRASRPADKPYKLGDAHQLYLLITPAGGKLWRMNYRFGGKQRALSFGAYPTTGLAEARQMRDNARLYLATGRDPKIAKRLEARAAAERLAATFETVARQWFERVKSQWAKVHAGDVIRSLERDVFPYIGSYPISDLKPPKILEVLRIIEDRPAIETAKRVRQRMSAVFVFAISSGLAQTDPAAIVAGALKPPLPKRNQPAIIELAPLQDMICKVERDPARPITRLAMRLLALTVVRPGELRGTRWTEFEELDGAYPLWRIPATRMKGDKSRKAEIGGDHLVPLAPQSVELLSLIRQLTGDNELVFPCARHPHKSMSENAIGYLLNRAGYHGRHVPHGFRSAFSTIMNEWANRHGNVDDRAIIDLMLAHVPKDQVEGAYNRAAYIPRRREIACLWADKLCANLQSAEMLLGRTPITSSAPLWESRHAA
ncbi:MAG: integrase arm-type DNA-binding domain-containing protein [Sphingomonadaceae bacterium]|nr:integrase arm-type DNA-binding domain-containing protein [Sphingomonadaceae bacterium]